MWGGGGWYLLIPATPSDCDLLLEWENEDECRKSSFCRDIILREDHERWFNQLYFSSRRNVFVLWEGNQPVAQVREEIYNKKIHLSYSVAKERRGCGYGKLLLLMYESMGRDYINSEGYIYGEVKKSNVASQKVFEELAYEKEERDDVYIYYKRINVSLNMRTVGALECMTDSIRHITRKGVGGVILLSNNRNSFEVYEWLNGRGECVCYYSGKLIKEQVIFLKPSVVVSYNYNYIIPEELIQLTNYNIINMHISYLPWNKGADPNFWSFIEDTPKGVTIHQISSNLDRGDILLQKRLYFDEKKETFKTAYEKLNSEIVNLLQENWDDLKNSKIIAHSQTEEGTYHKRKQLLEFMGRETLDWQENIHDFKIRKMVGQ